MLPAMPDFHSVWGRIQAMHKLASAFATIGCLASLGGFAYLGTETAIHLLPKGEEEGLPEDLGSMENPVREPEGLKELLQETEKEAMTVHYMPRYGAEHVDIYLPHALKSLRIVGGGEEADFSIALPTYRDFFLTLEDIDVRTSEEQFLNTNKTPLHLAIKGHVTIAHSEEYRFQQGYPLLGSREGEEVPIYIHMEERSTLEISGGAGTIVHKDGQRAIGGKSLDIFAPEDWKGNVILHGGDGWSPEEVGKDPGEGVHPLDLEEEFEDSTRRVIFYFGEDGSVPSL